MDKVKSPLGITGEFKIDKINGIYNVLYFEGTGMSILAKSKSLIQAKKRMNHFIKQFKAGTLMKEDKLCYVLWDVGIK